MRLAVRENDAERRYAAALLDVLGNVSTVLSLRLGADPALVKPARGADKGLPPEFLPAHATLETSRLFRKMPLAEPFELLFG